MSEYEGFYNLDMQPFEIQVLSYNTLWLYSQAAAAAAAKSLQSCPILCNPINGSPPGSPVPGILQARTLDGTPLQYSHDLR